MAVISILSRWLCWEGGCFCMVVDNVEAIENIRGDVDLIY